MIFLKVAYLKFYTPNTIVLSEYRKIPIMRNKSYKNGNIRLFDYLI